MTYILPVRKEDPIFVKLNYHREDDRLSMPPLHSLEFDFSGLEPPNDRRVICQK